MATTRGRVGKGRGTKRGDKDPAASHHERVGAGGVLELEREVARGARDALGERRVDLNLKATGEEHSSAQASRQRAAIQSDAARAYYRRAAGAYAFARA